MFDVPPVTVLICTYRRPAEIRRTLYALLDHLRYPAEKLRWLIADDSSGGTYTADLAREFKKLKLEFSITPTNGGWGRNVNQAIRRVSTDYFFFIEDDYVLTRQLDLVAGVAMLEVKPEIGMLRYRGTAGDHLVLHQMEADISVYHPRYREGVGLEGKMTYCLIDGNSPTLYIYSHGASLRRTSFHHFYNLYPEGLKLGSTEESYAHIVKDMMKLPGAPAIAIPPEWIAMHFDHIGVSFQLTEHDREG